MRASPGFPDRQAYTSRRTQSLAQLKVTLHMLRRLDAKREYPRYVRLSELRADPVTLASLQAVGGLSPEDALAEGVRLAVARGVLLALPVELAAPGEAAPAGAGAPRGAPGAPGAQRERDAPGAQRERDAPRAQRQRDECL